MDSSPQFIYPYKGKLSLYMVIHLKFSEFAISIRLNYSLWDSVNKTLLGDKKLGSTVLICKQVVEVYHIKYYDYIKSCFIRLVVVTLNKLADSGDKFPNQYTISHRLALFK